MIRPMVALGTAAAILAAGGCAVGSDRQGAAPPSPGSTSPSASAPGSGPVSPPVGSSVSPPPSGLVSPPASGGISPPSDLQPTGLVVGRIVRGGSGPCYGVETDDGKLYAVYSVRSGNLPVGTTVRVKTAPLLLKIYCGEGQPVSGLSIEVV